MQVKIELDVTEIYMERAKNGDLVVRIPKKKIVEIVAAVTGPITVSFEMWLAK